MPWNVLRALGLLMWFGCSSAFSAEYWVHGSKGSDSSKGSREEPFKSVPHAAKLLKPGDHLHVLPFDGHYPSNIRFENSGEVDAPIVIDFHGSIVSGLMVLSDDVWQQEGEGVYRRHLDNNAWGMYTHWEGGFPLVYFGEQAGVNTLSKKDLKAGAYHLYKNRKNAKKDPLHNTLSIMLPEGVQLKDVRSVTKGGGIYVGGSHVTVKNAIVEHGGRDGFSTHNNKGVVFENVTGVHISSISTGTA